jgi:hypothetical protein
VLSEPPNRRRATDENPKHPKKYPRVEDHRQN